MRRPFPDKCGADATKPVIMMAVGAPRPLGTGPSTGLSRAPRAVGEGGRERSQGAPIRPSPPGCSREDADGIARSRAARRWQGGRIGWQGNELRCRYGDGVLAPDDQSAKADSQGGTMDAVLIGGVAAVALAAMVAMWLSQRKSK